MDVPQEINKTMEEFWKGAKMEVLYPLVRALKLDSRELFNPEMKRESPTIRQLRCQARMTDFIRGESFKFCVNSKTDIRLG